MRSTLANGSRRQAFTLVEIMIIVALIGLLATLAIPTYVKARKQTQGKRIVNDARIIDSAIDSWSMENGKTDGDTVDLANVAQYTKAGTINPVDVIGNSYVIGSVGTQQVQVSSSTKTALSGVAIDWGAY